MITKTEFLKVWKRTVDTSDRVKRVKTHEVTTRALRTIDKVLRRHAETSINHSITFKITPKDYLFTDKIRIKMLLERVGFVVQPCDPFEIIIRWPEPLTPKI